MTINMIYLLCLALMSSNILCMPTQERQSNSTSCSWTNLKKCSNYLNLTSKSGKPLLPDEVLQIDGDRPIFINKKVIDIRDYRGLNSYTENSLLKDIPANKVTNEKITSHSDVQSAKEKFKSIITETITDNAISSETNTNSIDYDNTVTTTEAQEVTTEDLESRFRPEILIALLG